MRLPWQSSYTLESISFHLIFYIFEPSQTACFAYTVISFSLLSSIISFAQQSYFACPAVSFRLLNHITSPTKV